MCVHMHVPMYTGVHVYVGAYVPVHTKARAFYVSPQKLSRCTTILQAFKELCL